MNKSKEKGLLDDLAKSRKSISYIEPDINQHCTEKKSKKPVFKNNEDASKYGYKISEKHTYKPLGVSEQLRIAKGSKQAVIKITKYGKGIDGILAHMKYISRNYDLELEDQNGDKLSKPEELNELVDTWQDIYFDNRKNTRDTMHVVFSVPPDSNRDDFNTLMREFLSEEYEGKNDYLFVQHNDTDHPHVHAVIVLRTIDGKKLNPRKEYLHYLRKDFAKKCREYGIDVDASRRFERGLNGPSRRSEMVQMHKHRGIISESDMKLLDAVKSKGEEVQSIIDASSENPRNKSIRSHYYNTAKSLYETAKSASNNEEKKRNAQASKILYEYSQSMPHEPTLPELLKLKVDSKKTLPKADYELDVGSIEQDIKNIQASTPLKRDVDIDIDIDD